MAALGAFRQAAHMTELGTVGLAGPLTLANGVTFFRDTSKHANDSDPARSAFCSGFAA